jgi:carboxyl-terminal processing protease
VFSEFEKVTMTLEDRIFIASKVYQSITIYFAHWEDSSIKKDKLDEAFQELLNQTINCESKWDFLLLMMEFFAKLNNGHTNFGDMSFQSRLLPLGVTPRLIDNKWAVQNSYVNDLKEGDLILEIDGISVDEWYEKLNKYNKGSAALRMSLFGDFLLKLFLPDTYSIKFENHIGEIHSIVIDRTLLNISRGISTESKWITENDVGFIQIPSFDNRKFEDSALIALENMKHAKTLIIDVRNNGGGSTPSKLISALMNQPYRWWSESSPVNVGIFAYNATHKSEKVEDLNFLWNSTTLHPLDNAFQGNLILLSNHGTGSAAEDFLVPFKDNRRATIIGETTSGSTGQPFFYQFNNNMAFWVSTKRAYFPNGTQFEGIGIKPDVEIHITREDLYKKTDLVLQRAILLTGR